MWLLKGTIYGIVAFAFFGLIFFFSRFGFSTHKAFSLRTLEFLTIHNPWFWAAFVLMVCTGCVCARLLRA